VITPEVRAGQPAIVEATFGEALPVPPAARVVGGPTMVTVPTAQGNVWRFRLDVTGTELEGPMSVVVDAQDAAGNAATRTATDAFVLDFTPPALGAGSPLVDTPNVRAGQQIVVHAGFTEPLAAAPSARLLGRATAATIPLAVAEQIGTAYTFGATVQPAAAEEIYDVQIGSFADVAGNAGTDVTAGGTVNVDRTAPSLSAGPTATKAGARYRKGDQPSFTLTVSEELAGTPSARLTTIPALALPCAPAGGNGWTCTAAAALTGAELPESAVKAVFDLADPAGNTATFSTDAILDFHDPVIVGSVALDLTPPPGSLVSPVTAVRAGTRIRVSFTVSEPLSIDPVVVTSTPEALSFGKVSQSGTFYVYEHVLDAAAHAQGAYALRAQLTDLAGNSVAPLLALPAPGLRVDTVTPVVPDVVTTDRITYARAPWGTAATGGAPQFTVTGLAGSVEGNATVIAFDDDYLTSAREVGRATATGGGAFSMTLIPADRREVFLVAVDGAGNASDADAGAAGTQAVRIRDVTWTASMMGKVAGSTTENPHRLEARSRWIGALEQGASVEAGVPASTRGSLGWTLATNDAWATGKIAADPRRGRLVVPTVGTVWEWDGEVWTSTAATGGPSAITATVYDARRGEVLVYEGRCQGGTTLWAWTGSAWEARAQGASYTEWLSSQAHPPGPHYTAFLLYDEARGEVILAPGRMANLSPYTCGDVAGSFDYTTYRWDGSAWTALPGPTTSATADGRLIGYDVSRQVVVRKTVSGVQEWNGIAWGTVDPAGITTGPSATASGETVYDPVSQRLLFQADGSVWSWTGTNWVRGTASVAGNLVKDAASNRALNLTAAGMYRWTGGGWSLLTGTSTVPPSPVGLVYSAARGRMEAFDASGAVYRWLNGAWSQLAVGTRPPGITGAGGLDATGTQSLAFAADDGTWRWDGSTWTSLTPATSLRPLTPLGMSYVPGTGAVSLDDGGVVFTWSTDRWNPSGTRVSPTCWGAPAAAGALPGVYFACVVPFNPDHRLYQWTAAGGTSLVFGAAGHGTIRPIAADGSNRTFVLQQYGALQLSGSSLVEASIDDPRGVGYPRGAIASAWDASQQSVVVLEGTRTWNLESEGRSRPGHLFRVAWPTGGGAGGDCFQRGGSCTVRSVTAAWAGALAAAEGSAGASATLSLWNDSQWYQVASATSLTAGAPTSATGAVTDPTLLARLAVGRPAEIDVAVVMSTASLPAPLLRTDDVSVTVTYRLP
jgi:hypothetical protein